MRIGPEQAIQIAVCEFCALHRIPFIHIANERKTSYVQGALLKRMGVVRGASDCFMPRGNTLHKGLFLELKTTKGKPTLFQISFLEKMRKEGYMGLVAYGLDQALDHIKNFYSLK